jgi:integrase
MKLDKKAVDGLTLPQGKSEVFLFDDAVPGFGIRRRGNSKVWIFQYRLGNRQRRMTLGAVSAVPLTDARKTAGELHARVKLGQDPAGDKTEAREKAAETFSAAAVPFLARQRERLRPRTYLEVERHVHTQAKLLHGMALAKIERRDIARLLTGLVEGSGPSAANHCRATLSTFFAWAVREGLIDSNPVTSTNKATVAGARERVLSDGEVREIWAALGDDDYGDIVRLLALSGARRDEIGSLDWTEVDLRRRLIILPGSRTKNKRPFEIPLSQPALEILQKRTPLDGREFVFGEGRGGFSGWSACKKRLDARIAASRGTHGKAPMPNWRLHDLRRTMSTVMHERLGILPHIVEACLNHVSGHMGGVAGVYNRATYEAEKRQALDRWATHVCAVVEERDSNVVPLCAQT